MITAVTGATGHVGANLVRALVASGRRVRCVDCQDRAALEGLGVWRASLSPSRR
jgi:hydroxymethylglutaryl-CoA reductase/dihydroflavonol-4-reductase